MSSTLADIMVWHALSDDARAGINRLIADGIEVTTDTSETDRADEADALAASYLIQIEKQAEENAITMSRYQESLYSIEDVQNQITDLRDEIQAYKNGL